MKKRVWIGVAVLAAAGAATFWFKPEPEIRVAVVPVDRGDVTASVTNTRAGTVDACRRAGIAPATGGQIDQLLVAEGDRVVAGQLLLSLWNDDFAAQLELTQREAQAAAARAEQACITARVAKHEAERIQQLHAQKLASEDRAERATGDAQSQQLGCEAQRAAEAVALAQVDVAAATLERTRLRAPFAGIVAEINGELGEFVTPSPIGIPTPPTVDLIDSSCLYISAPIDEIDAPRVRAGMRAYILLDAMGDRRFSGHVRRVAPYVLDMEKQARTVEVEAEIDDPDKAELLPGYSADVEVILGMEQDVLRVPSSVVSQGNRVLVLTEPDGLIEARTIEPGLANWEFTEVKSGLALGDLVITSIDRAGVEPGRKAVAEPRP